MDKKHWERFEVGALAVIGALVVLATLLLYWAVGLHLVRAGVPAWALALVPAAVYFVGWLLTRRA